MYKTLPFGHNSTLMKGHFASEILYISTICFAKLSILVIFHTIFQKQRTHRRSVLIFGYFILAWSVASGLAVVLRCALPNLLKALSSQSVNAVSHDEYPKFEKRILISVAHILGRILQHRCHHWITNHLNIHLVGNLSPGPYNSQVCYSCLFCSTCSRSLRCHSTFDLALSSEVAYQHSIPTLGSCNHHTSTTLLEHMYSLCPIYGTFFPGFGSHHLEIKLHSKPEELHTRHPAASGIISVVPKTKCTRKKSHLLGLGGNYKCGV